LGAQAMEFAQSKGQARKEGLTNVRFEDVAGLDETLTELKEVVEFLKDPKRYAALNAKPPKGHLAHKHCQPFYAPKPKPNLPILRYYFQNCFAQAKSVVQLKYAFDDFGSVYSRVNHLSPDWKTLGSYELRYWLPAHL
jgi:hypothetical protein